MIITYKVNKEELAELKKAGLIEVRNIEKFFGQLILIQINDEETSVWSSSGYKEEGNWVDKKQLNEILDATIMCSDIEISDYIAKKLGVDYCEVMKVLKDLNIEIEAETEMSLEEFNEKVTQIELCIQRKD